MTRHVVIVCIALIALTFRSAVFAATLGPEIVGGVIEQRENNHITGYKLMDGQTGKTYDLVLGARLTEISHYKDKAIAVRGRVVSVGTRTQLIVESLRPATASEARDQERALDVKEEDIRSGKAKVTVRTGGTTAKSQPTSVAFDQVMEYRGTVEVTRMNGNLSARFIDLDRNYLRYNISMDEKGRALANSATGEVRVKGKVTKAVGIDTLTIQ